MKSDKEWMEEIQHNSDYDKWRYNYQKFQSLIALIQSDARKQGVLDGLDLAVNEAKPFTAWSQDPFIRGRQTASEDIAKLRAEKMKEGSQSGKLA